MEKSNYAETLESMKICGSDKISEIIVNNKKSIDKSVISQKSKELSSIQPLEVCKLVVNKIHKYLSNDAGAKDFIKKVFDDENGTKVVCKKYNWTPKIISVNGYSCILVSDKDNKFIECTLPISGEESMTLELNHVATILAK